MKKRPIRIQLSRRKGWRIPENTVSVARPGQWGNPFTVDEYGRRLAIFNFSAHIRGMCTIGARDISELRGKNLACWCRLCSSHADGKPLGVTCNDCELCHADVLLELANN